MLISECLTSIYKRFEKSSDTPDPLTEDYIVRLEYVNASIDKWQNEQGIEWKELFGEITGTLTAGMFNNQTTLADFKKPSGQLRVGTDKYEYIRPEGFLDEQERNPSRKIYTVMGSRGQYTIKVFPVVDGSFTLPYRKYATKYTTGTENTPHIQMSDPEFIIHDVLAQLYLDDDNGTQANVEIQISGAKMEAMRLANETEPFNNDNKIPEDDDFVGFGK